MTKHTKKEFWMAGDESQSLWDIYGRQEGNKFLFTSAPYNWAVTFPKKREIVEFVEGDVYTNTYDTIAEYDKALKKLLNWLKNNNPSAYVEMKEDFYDDYMKEKDKSRDFAKLSEEQAKRSVKK